MIQTKYKTRYSLEPSYKKCVHGQGFMSLAKNMSNKYSKKLLNKSIDVSKDFAKTAGKKVLNKSAEAAGEMIGNKVVDRIARKPRNKIQKEDDRIMEETQELIIPPEKRQQIIKDLKLF